MKIFCIYNIINKNLNLNNAKIKNSSNKSKTFEG